MPNDMKPANPRIAHADLTRFIAAAYRAVGIPEADAAKAAELVDGDNGLGSLVVARAVEEAIALARDHGVGWVGTRNGNHAGAAAVYAAMPLAHDMIGLYFAVGNANHLPPWGGSTCCCRPIRSRSRCR